MQRIALALAVLAPFFAARAETPLPASQILSAHGLVRLATGVQTPPLPGTPQAAAKSFALSHANALGIAGAELSEGTLQQTRLGSVVRMSATYQGLPVLNQEVVVSFDASMRVRRVASSTEPIVAAVLLRRLDAAQAIARSSEGLGGILSQNGKPAGASREVVYVKDGVAHLAYEVHPATLDPRQNWYAVIDAATGEVLSRVNRVRRAADAGTPDTGPLETCTYDAGVLVHTDQAKVWATNPGGDGGTPMISVDLQNLPTTRDPQGRLVGTLLDAFTCCPNANCHPPDDAKAISGTVIYPPFCPVATPCPFRMVFCDLQHRASNLMQCRQDYDYSAENPLAIDPPMGLVGAGDPGDSDVFSEVHVYYHANRAYDYFRVLSDDGSGPTFLLRDALAVPPMKTQVWSNMVFPDFNHLVIGNPIRINTFMREDNSMFMAKENWAGLPADITDPPNALPTTDVIMLFQGPSADFGYDGEVVYHEFTHAVVTSTSNIGGPILDTYGGLDQGGSMNEGIADYFSSAIAGDPLMGEWIGFRLPASPNGDGAMRDLVNTNKCPDDIVGEVHHDSLVFSGATWKLRTQFLGTDQGKTFDAAVFDALSSVQSTAGFADMANAVADSVATAFSTTRPNAHAEVMAEYTARGMAGCVRVLSYTAPQSQLFVGGTNDGYAPYAPGPLQFKIHAPAGAGGLTVTATYAQASIDPLSINGGGVPSMHALTSVNQQIIFTGSVNAVADDAALSTPFVNDTVAKTTRVTASLTAAPGDDIYLAITNDSAPQWFLGNLTLTLEVPAGLDAGQPGLDASGSPSDAQVTGLDANSSGADASVSGKDANQTSGSDASTTPPKPGGCGCGNGASTSPLALAASLLLLAIRRRRREG